MTGLPPSAVTSVVPAPLTATPLTTEAGLEFDRQVDALVLAGLPALLDVKEACLRAMVEPLRDLLPAQQQADDGGSGPSVVPFVIVVPEAPVPPVLAAVHTAGGQGFTTMEPGDLARFRPLPELDVPAVPYLLLGVDTGPDTLGLPPAAALPRIAAAGRTPLTVAEGLALLVTDPGVLRSRNCFSLPGSRAGDKRVPGLWVSARRARLGWCYQGAAHSWLGTASCAGRRVA